MLTLSEHHKTSLDIVASTRSSAQLETQILKKKLLFKWLNSYLIVYVFKSACFSYNLYIRIHIIIIKSYICIRLDTQVLKKSAFSIYF